MSAHPPENPASHETDKPATEAHGHDKKVQEAAESTHARVTEAAKPEKPAKETLAELKAEHDDAKKKEIIEHLHLSPEEAKDAHLKKEFMDAVHGNHDLEELLKKKFEEAEKAEKADHAKDHGNGHDHKEGHGAHDTAHDAGHDAAHGGDHAKEDHGNADGHHDAHDKSAPHGHESDAAHAAAVAHNEAHGGHTEKDETEPPGMVKSVLAPIGATVQTGWIALKTLGALTLGNLPFMGWFRKRYQGKAVLLKPPVVEKKAKAALADHGADHAPAAHH